MTQICYKGYDHVADKLNYKRICKSCEYLKSLYSRDMEAELRGYIAALPEEIKVSENIYAQRLEECSKCDGCVDGLCRWCGCFVAARAVKKKLYCPNPSGRRWETADYLCSE